MGGPLSLPENMSAYNVVGTCLTLSKSMEINALGEPRIFQWALRGFAGGSSIGRPLYPCQEEQVTSASGGDTSEGLSLSQWKLDGTKHLSTSKKLMV